MDNLRKYISSQYLISYAACAGAHQVGCIMGWWFGVVSLIERGNSPLIVDNEQENRIFFVTIIGAVFGSLIAGSLAESIGRRTTLMITSVPTFCSWLIILFLPYLIVIYVATFILGLVMGILSTVVPMYIGEIAEKSVRGQLLAMFQTFIYLAGTIILVFRILDNYYALTIPGLVFGVLLLLITREMPESPSYLIEHVDDAQVEAALKKLRASDYVPTADMQELKDAKTARHNKSFGQIALDISNAKSILFSTFLMMLQQCCGINGLTYHYDSLLTQSDPLISPTFLVVTMSVIAIMVSIISGIFIDTVGRRTILIISGLGMSLSFWILSCIHCSLKMSKAYNFWITVTPLLVYLVSFAAGWAYIPWVITGELFSSEIKFIGNGIVITIHFIAAYVMIISGNLVFVSGDCLFFSINGNVNLLGVIIAVFYMPETNQKTFKQIQDELLTKPVTSVSE